ncbi:TetR/AcrR family transcriptional regulator [Pseudodesulfovibrio piezophilus]|uniref:Transcriptional regulator, TetR family n=1 Tax=Pseudodesulfovibrio piezophilus (strain DSM 21447 / JCM 15486 / C1TLV30) TaxID=1322246 RepID=M1WMF4_PSEP2|nr:TetR/AcrR family transcriptional regulator [Pseudodesulfovibrio piezophilus]CCH49510.1 Transcriptional regulator, TetR family [Pseudodesulfovibrio piezophilus C1TLV30]
MKKKEAILKVATVMFANKGFVDTSGQELARMTGVAEGTIFYHFGSKEGLLLAILEKTRDEIVDQFEQFFENRPFASGLEMIEEVVAFHLYLAGLMEDKFLLLHRHFLYKFSESNQGFRQNLEAIYNCLVDIFEKAIATGRADGSISQDVNPRKSALILFTMVDGLVRFKNYNLYDAGALFNELMAMCRRMLRAECHDPSI